MDETPLEKYVLLIEEAKRNPPVSIGKGSIEKTPPISKVIQEDC